MAVASPPLAPDGIAPETPEDYDPGLFTLQDQWDAAVTDMMTKWPKLQAAWEDDLLDKMQQAVLSGDPVGLSGILPDVGVVPDEIRDMMLDLAVDAGLHTREQAAKQSIDLPSAGISGDIFQDIALAVANAIGAGLAMSVVRETMRNWGYGSTSNLIEERVRIRLGELTLAQPEYMIGGAATSAQHVGRMLTARGGPGAALYSSEILDGRTCKYCRAVHRRWLGNLDDPEQPWLRTYPIRGYVDCLGHDRCRGMIVYVWRGGDDWREWVEKEPFR